AKKEHVQNICFFATALAKYGDVVHVYLGIDRSKYFVSSFPTHPATNTHKWPLIGVFQKGDDSWFDEPNGGEIL
ncbi:MAG: hypothetical protein WC485_11350, partial [Opitutaceae bacterium]